MGVAYCTREDVKRATDSAETARNNARVDRAIQAVSRSIDQRMHRPHGFAPLTATRTLDWPPPQRSRSWVLELGEHTLISVATLVSGGVTIPAADYFLRPDDGPPYTRIEIDLESSSAWAAGNTHQRAISIAGVFGYSNDEESAAALAEALDSSETGVDIGASTTVGVGSLLRVDTERMIVTGLTMADTGQNIGGNLTAANNQQTVPVTTGTAYAVGEVILVDAERMLIDDIAGNTLIVRRAWDGTTLAAHTTGADIYAPRTLTVTRGAQGTTAATHDTAAAVYVWLPPAPIRDLAIGLAIVRLQNEAAGYARTAGSGESERQVTGRQIADLWRDADFYRRKARGGAV